MFEFIRQLVKYMKSKKVALIIGGSGILGIPVVLKLIAHGEYEVHYVALEEATDPKFPSSVISHIVDKNGKDYIELIHNLNQEVGIWDVVVDLIAFDDKSAEATCNLFRGYAKHIITISTTLVYDRTRKNDGPITENNPLAPEGVFGGYVDGKLRLEKFWHSVKDVNWTLFRPYHVLGPHSLIGCVPYHNRDPKLVEKIMKGESLLLCNGGNIEFNFVHPRDIAEAIYNTIGKEKTFGQAYNLVNPQPILAKDYYEEFARQLRKTVKIETVSMDEIWGKRQGWEMTTLPHVYSVEKIKRDIDFVPRMTLSEGIRDAINKPPVVRAQAVEEIPVHKRMNLLPRPNKPDWLK